MQPTSLTIQLTDHSIKQPVVIVKDIPIQVGRFIIPCDFIVMDMDVNSRVSIILRRPFLATIGMVIDVQAGTISFQMCREMMDFCFPLPTPFSMPIIPPPSVAPVHIVPCNAISRLQVFDGDEGPHMLSGGFFDFSTVVSISFGTTSSCNGKVVDPTHIFTRLLVHLLYHFHIPFRSKGQVKDLK